MSTIITRSKTAGWRWAKRSIERSVTDAALHGSARPTLRSTKRSRDAWSISPAGPSAVVQLDLQREMIGSVACENLTHFFQSLATAARMTLHLDVLRGANDHHRAEVGLQSLRPGLRAAVACEQALSDDQSNSQHERNVVSTR